jgi:hypothetical protein
MKNSGEVCKDRQYASRGKTSTAAMHKQKHSENLGKTTDASHFTDGFAT